MRQKGASSAYLSLTMKFSCLVLLIMHRIATGTYGCAGNYSKVMLFAFLQCCACIFADPGLDNILYFLDGALDTETRMSQLFLSWKYQNSNSLT